MIEPKSIQLEKHEIQYIDKPDERDKLLVIKTLQKEKISKALSFLYRQVQKEKDKEVGFPFLVSRLVNHMTLIEAIKIAKIYRQHVQGVKMDW